MIEGIANRLAIGIKNKAPDHPASVAVLQYSLSFILNTVAIISFSLIVSIFTGKVTETIVALVGFALLRQVSGGYHLKSGLLCIIISTLVVIAVSLVECNGTVTLAMNIIAALLVLIFAPSGIENKTKIPARYFPLLKLVALIMIFISILLAYPVLAATFLAQALLLIRLGR